MRILLSIVLLLGSCCAQTITVLGTKASSQTSTFTVINPLLLTDSNGGHWAVTMNDFGILLSQTTSKSTSTVYQIDSVSDASTWTFGITTGGQITLTKSAAFLPSVSSTYSFLSTGGHSAVLWNLAGILRNSTPQ